MSLLLHTIGQPRAAEIPHKEPPPSLYRAAPRSGSSPRKGLLLSPSTEQPRAAGAPPERASSLPLSSSPVQRELPQKGPPPSFYRAAPRSGSSLRKIMASSLPPSIGRPPPIDTLGGTMDADVAHLYSFRYNRRTCPADGYSRRTAPACRYNRRMSPADGYNRRTQNSRR